MFQGATSSEGNSACGHYIDDVIRSSALLLALTAPVAAEPCKPHAQLDGDAAAVASVTAELVKLGVVVGATAPAGCKTVFAAVELARDGGLAIAVKTGSQSEGRTVSDAVVAASWIDSWVADDFAPPEPAANGFFELRPASPAGSSRAPGADVEVEAAPTSSSALGISATACAQLGAWCFGARARYAAQNILVGQTAAARSDVSGLATASYAWKLGRLQVVPELGLGVGRMSTTRVDGCRHVCDPQTPGCMGPQTDMECAERDPEHSYALDINDHLHTATITPRAAARLELAFAISKSIFLEGAAAFMLAPFGHSDHYDLAMGTSPPFGVPVDQLALPGEPIGTFELGLGLRWESR